MSRSSLTIYGGAKVDFLYLDRNSDIDANLFNYKYVPKLNKDTVLLCNYTNDRNGLGSVKESDGVVFDVYREKNKNSQLEYVTTIQSGALEVYDYDVANQTDYRYYVFPSTQTENSSPLESNTVRTDWWNWSVVGVVQDETNPNVYYVDSDNIWLFDMNLESAEQVQNYAKTVYQTFGKYPRVSTGNLNYTTSSITCLIARMYNNTFTDTVDMLERWREFCNNSQLKILKDRKGQVMIVDIIDTSNKFDDVSKEQVNSITFSYTQIGDTKDISIIER